MRRLLNTLYVTMPDSYLASEGENVLIKVKDEVKFRVPIHNLEGIVCFGFTGASPGLMHLCCERGVVLSFLTEYGKFKGRVTGSVSGNILLRRGQYRWADSPQTSLRLAKRFITAKVANCRAVLQRLTRDHADSIDYELVSNTIRCLTEMIEQINEAGDLDILRGMEGHSARLYFNAFNQLFLSKNEDFHLSNRNKHPPLDRINALLSFIYTLLTHEMVSALESTGLDPQAGFLHRDRPGRQSLALDMMEELRPHLADRLAVSMINRNQINASGFIIKENGAVIMDEDTRKEVLTSWQKRKQEELVHPYLQEKIPLGLVPYTQALLLARHIRGDLEDYPPFFWK